MKVNFILAVYSAIQVVQIHGLRVFTSYIQIFSHHYGLRIDPHNAQLPVGLISTGGALHRNRRGKGSNPRSGLNFPAILATAYVAVLTARIIHLRFYLQFKYMIFMYLHRIYRISSNNSRPSINRLPRIIAPL